MNQKERVLLHLYRHGSITTLEAFERYGISRLAACVWDIRHKAQIPIKSELVTVKNRYDEDCHVARYTL